jgi:D-serine deaminase-like pyridoxal phosphate-dependent protein
MTTIHDLPTPALLLDLDVLDANLEWMAARAAALGVSLRPHVKSHKCIEIGRRQQSLGAVGLSVSTFPEARIFAAHGFDDITWAHPFVPRRLPDARELAERITLRLVVDSPEAATALEKSGHSFHVWLKIDSGYHRAGVDPTSQLTGDLATSLSESPTLRFDGLLTHGGHAYNASSPSEVRAAAAEERETVVGLAARLRSLGVPVPAVSVGSTPGMAVVEHLTGVDETRPGNYPLHDHTQVLLGTCTPKQCAVSALATVVSSQPGAAHCVTDAGSLALSKDPGRGMTARQTMGEIFDDYSAGVLRSDARLTSLSQEHGVVNAALPLHSRIRILPNHSCLTVACFDKYHVVQGETVVDEWRIHRERD